jgi:uncharacterized protein YecE (DUF72 family)
MHRVGTSGWSYDEWHGPFYPEDLAAGERLRFYAARLPAVEVNNTFYRLPRASVLEGWAASVPEAFRFALKASRRITHIKRLKDARDETEYLLRTAQALGGKLGPILFQLPPNLKLDLDRFDAFLERLPAGTRAAFEFRHESWRDERVLERLRARALAWCQVDGDEAELGEIVPTAPYGYLRLRRAEYTPEALTGWARRIAGAGFAGSFVFLKHEDAGAGPRLAAALLEQLALVAARPGPLRAQAERTSRREAG